MNGVNKIATGERGVVWMESLHEIVRTVIDARGRRKEMKICS
jgi:hypothetical protein